MLQAQIAPLEQSLRQQYNEFQQAKATMQAQISQLQAENQSLKSEKEIAICSRALCVLVRTYVLECKSTRDSIREGKPEIEK